MTAVIRRHVLTAYAMCAFIYLLLPIAVVIAFSFNNPAGRFNYTWQGFTLDNWINWNSVPGLADSMVLSLEIAAISSIVATALGTLIALALVRHGFHGRGATNLLVFLPMSTPEIVLGAALLTLFLQLKIPTGFLTIAIAHIMFIISYAVVTVKARLISFDRHLEEAAMDLGANEVTTFRKVTLPLIAPAMLAAALLVRSHERGFGERYERFLAAGNSGPPEKLLAMVGVDLRDSDIWEDGFSVLEGWLKTISA